MNLNNTSINSVISRYFIVASISVLFVALIGAIAFNNHSLHVMRVNNSQKTHEIISDFLVPAITIGDTTEVHRALSLVTDSNQIYAVMNSNRDVYLSDYSNLSIVNQIYNLNGIHSCADLKTNQITYNGEKYWVNCSTLIDNSQIQKNAIGLLLSFSKTPWLWLSTFTAYFIGIAIVSLLLITIWFKRILHNRLLKPLIKLGTQIVDVANSPIESEIILCSKECLPSEIEGIKKAFHHVLNNLRAEYKKRTKFEKDVATFELAARVAHDIRSPLAAIEITISSLARQSSQKEITILREAVQSIRDIANNLLSQYQNNEAIENTLDFVVQNNTESSFTLFSTLIETVISQKRVEWKNKKILLEFNNIHHKDIWIMINPTNFKRMLSNLLNNAYESIQNNGQIFLEVYARSDSVLLSIKDNGCGIETDNIGAVLSGLSSKHHGKGLGLSSAAQFMRQIDGSLDLRSTPGAGTEILLTFNKNLIPPWFPDRINLKNCKMIMTLDDNSAMQSFWQERLNQFKITLKQFKNYTDAINWVTSISDLNNIIFIIDYDLGCQVSTGIDFVTYVNQRKNCYLVTSSAENKCIQDMVVQKNIWLIPKSLANDIIFEL